MSTKIVHLSDLHVAGHDFVPEWSEARVSQVSSARPDLVVVTGDLTHTGRWREYEQARDFLRRLQTRVLLVVPGNHDTTDFGPALFAEMFGSCSSRYENDGVIVCGVDSTRLDVTRARKHVAQCFGPNDRVHVLALHHHPVPRERVVG